MTSTPRVHAKSTAGSAETRPDDSILLRIVTSQAVLKSMSPPTAIHSWRMSITRVRSPIAAGLTYMPILATPLTSEDVIP